MEQVIDGNHLFETYGSLPELVKVACERDTHAKKHVEERAGTDFMGYVNSWDEVLTLARDGWTEKVPEVMRIAEEAVTDTCKEHYTDTFVPTWDVTGAAVDVGRFVSGEPECMIDFPLTETSKVGRVITLVVGVGVNGATSGREITDRGVKVVALAMALAQLGHAVEIWADDTQTGNIPSAPLLFQRILIKGSHDEIDPALLMFALAHPTFQRGLKWATWDGLPGQWRQACSEALSRCRTRAERNKKEKALYPEGAIFVPSTQSYEMRGVTPKAFVEKHLREIGLLAE